MIPPTQFYFAVGEEHRYDYDVKYVAITTKEDWEESHCLSSSYGPEGWRYLNEALAEYAPIVGVEYVEGMWEVAKQHDLDAVRDIVSDIPGLTYSKEFQEFMDGVT